MKCDDVSKWFMTPYAESYPEEVRRHLEECRSCRDDLARQQFVYQMLALKRHEGAADGSAAETAGKIRSELSDIEDSEIGRFRPADARWLVKPLMQTAAAAVFIILAGSLFFRISDPNIARPRRQHVLHTASPDLPSVHSTAPDWLETSTNMTPAEIRYGPLRSRLVEYEVPGD